MKFQICTPITASTIEECLALTKKLPDGADLFEVRADYIQGFRASDAEKIRSRATCPMIFTCRCADEGGKWSGTEHERIKVLIAALNAGFEYIDVEYQTAVTHPDLMSLKQKTTKIILSFHDFEETPSYQELTKLVQDMRRYGPNIIKMATMPRNETDVQSLYRVLTNNDSAIPHIIIAMGELGKQSRIIAPLLGSPTTYAQHPAFKQAAAPGQYTIDEMLSIYRAIGMR